MFLEALIPGTKVPALPEFDFNTKGVDIKPVEFLGIIKLASLGFVTLEGFCLSEVKEKSKIK